jgi:hypothetical protein
MSSGITYTAASFTAPPSPQIGTVYFDQTEGLYKIYTATGWSVISQETEDPTGPIRELLASSVDIDDPFIAEVRDELLMRLKLIAEDKPMDEFQSNPWYAPAGLTRGLMTPSWCKENDDTDD